MIAFDTAQSVDSISEQELALVGSFLSELLKEMMWQASEQEN
jgi:hypothetical protein